MARLSRRRFLQYGAAAGFTISLSGRMAPVARAGPVLGPTLDPRAIPKYVTPLVIPPAMPRTTKLQQRMAKNVDYYEIAVRQFGQQILPPGFPGTTVWSYGSVNHPGSFNYPAFTIEAKNNAPVRVKWINELVDGAGRALPHLFPVDQTLHWANPPGGVAGRDTRPEWLTTPGPYRGPVPLVTHVHGAHAVEEADGYAEAWYLPNALDVPAGYARGGSLYDPFRAKAEAALGQAWEPGTAVFQYGNDQPASTLWYHDHALGMTRLNVYAGPAGFYVVRGGRYDLDSRVLPGPAPALGDPPGLTYYEIPIAIQDRSFNLDGSLFYPDSRTFFDEYEGPFVPDGEVSPIWNPEFFGNAMVVNGRTWPTLQVEPRRYRLRLLNGCNSRFLVLKLENGMPFWQIGAEGGFLPAPVQLDRLLMAPAERADVIVDFAGLAPGTTLTLLNLGPDDPFPGGEPGEHFEVADPETTGQVMRFEVVPMPRGARDRSVPPSQLTLPAPPPPAGAIAATRQLSLNEMMTMGGMEEVPVAAMLGLVENGEPVHKMWADPITETPGLGTTEVWEFHNFTGDAHPMHMHLVQFQVLNREGEGGVRAPEPWETGLKDTVIAYPEEVTRVKATFDLPGLYVWHCHIVEHEDNEMMRPYRVV